MVEFEKTFSGKTVLILGHTGFKGSWLTLWLHQVGARICGVSVDIPTDPSHYEAANIASLCDSRFIDIRDRDTLMKTFSEVSPDFVFHLAAQALVGEAYNNPVKTFEVNTFGTINLLECMRQSSKEVTAVLITSDKCYENIETVHGYRETDRLGGKDPYSASKAAAEIAIQSYVQSFFSSHQKNLRLAVGRAGNVIGGGDWAEGRLIPDIVKSWTGRTNLKIRSLSATRPWQYVLEPLSGYMRLAAQLSYRDDLMGEPFNFGPRSEDVATVQEIVEHSSRHLSGINLEVLDGKSGSGLREAGLLKLSCDKAQHALQWRPVLRLDEALEQTLDWYCQFYSENSDMQTVSEQYIGKYCELAAKRGHLWAKG
jgi:CDP-glucose 4,6-dehydratase